MAFWSVCFCWLVAVSCVCNSAICFLSRSICACVASICSCAGSGGVVVAVSARALKETEPESTIRPSARSINRSFIHLILKRFGRLSNARECFLFAHKPRNSEGIRRFFLARERYPQGPQYRTPALFVGARHDGLFNIFGGKVFVGNFFKQSGNRAQMRYCRFPFYLSRIEQKRRTIRELVKKVVLFKQFGGFGKRLCALLYKRHKTDIYGSA